MNLILRRIKYEFKQSISVYYKGHKVVLHYLDFLIKNEKESIVVELKATSTRTTPRDKAQLRSYIHTLGFESGLMINFFHDHPSDPIIDEVLLNGVVPKLAEWRGSKNWLAERLDFMSQARQTLNFEV